MKATRPKSRKLSNSRDHYKVSGATNPIVGKQSTPTQPVTLATPKVEVSVVLPAQKSPLTEPATYAAGLPGVAVAIAGFLVVHWLARRRDREKRLTDLSQDVIELADKAAATASAGWVAAKGTKRQVLVNQAKQDFQTLGVAVTRISRMAERVARRSWVGDAWRHRSIGLLCRKRSINLAEELKNFRTTALHDPFDDPARGPDHEAVADIRIELGNFALALDEAVAACLP